MKENTGAPANERKHCTHWTLAIFSLKSTCEKEETVHTCLSLDTQMPSAREQYPTSKHMPGDGPCCAPLLTLLLVLSAL